MQKKATTAQQAHVHIDDRGAVWARFGDGPQRYVGRQHDDITATVLMSFAAEVERLGAERDKLHERLESAEERLESAEDRNAELAAEVERLRDIARTHEQRSLALMTERDSLVLENRSLGDRVQNAYRMEGELVATRAERDEAQALAGSLREELDALNGEGDFDVSTAAGDALDVCASARGIERLPDEPDEDLRERCLAAPVLSPGPSDAVSAAIEAVADARSLTRAAVAYVATDAAEHGLLQACYSLASAHLLIAAARKVDAS